MSRKEVFDVAAGRLMQLMNMPGLFRGERFLRASCCPLLSEMSDTDPTDPRFLSQTVEWSQTFLAAGEAFVCGELTELRGAVAGMTIRFFEPYHRNNMEVRVRYVVV